MNLKLVVEGLGVAFLGLSILSAVSVTVVGLRRAVKEQSPPGFLPQFLVSSLVVVVILLGGFDVGQFAALVKESSLALAGLIPLSLSPWLIYKHKSKQGGHEVEAESKPTGGTP